MSYAPRRRELPAKPRHARPAFVLPPKWQGFESVHLRSALRGFSGGHLSIEFCRFSARHRQRIPFRSGKMFGEINDLPDVIRSVGDAAIDRLHNGMGLTTDMNCAAQVRLCQGRERLEQRLPARFPEGE